MTTTTKKRRKVDEVAAALVKAREHLAAREAVLRPLIREEATKIAVLKLEVDRTSKVHEKLYDEGPKLRRQVLEKLGLRDTTVLMSKLLLFVNKSGLAKADTKKLAEAYINRAVAADLVFQEHRELLKTASLLKDVAYRKWNVANHHGKPMDKMLWELEEHAKTISDLEAELDKIPLRNEQARDKRAQEKEEAEVQRQTAEALRLLAETQL